MYTQIQETSQAPCEERRTDPYFIFIFGRRRQRRECLRTKAKFQSSCLFQNTQFDPAGYSNGAYSSNSLLLSYRWECIIHMVRAEYYTPVLLYNTYIRHICWYLHTCILPVVHARYTWYTGSRCFPWTCGTLKTASSCPLGLPTYHARCLAPPAS